MTAMTNLPSAYIAFQGGGALGMAHLGAWQEVSQQFSIIGTAGTSAGSIVSALCAAGFNPAHTIDLFHQLNWAEYVNRQSFLRLVIEQDAYSDGRRFHRWLRDQLGKNVPGKPSDINFADLYRFRNIYLAVIACDLNNQAGDPVVFDKDTESQTTVSFAVRASISIPGLFKPMSRIDRRQELVDGGVLLNFPVDPLYQRAKEANCTLIGVRFKQPPQYLESPKVREALKGTINLMMRRGSLPPDHIAQAPNYIDIEIDVTDFNPLDFALKTAQKEELVKRGALAAERALDKYKLRIQKQQGELLDKFCAEIVPRVEKVATIGKEADLTEKALKSRPEHDNSRQLEDALDWLNNRYILAEKAGKSALDEALEKFPELTELKKKEDDIKRFYWEIEKYLELVYNSLLTQRTNLLREPKIRQSLPYPSVYIAALDNVKSKIPEDINGSVRQSIEKRIDFLKGRIT
jgi:predicted acylesterase/phospholipase RssA